jgi:hypothetical protein
MTRLGLIRPNQNDENSIRFVCRSPRLSLAFDAGSSAPETQVAP